MKFYIGDRLVRVDMVHRYRYAVMEGDKVISFQKNKKDAEEVAAGWRSWRNDTIGRFEKALRQDELYRLREPSKISRSVWDDYHCAAEIFAAIGRMRKIRDTIRVVPLKITK